MREAIDARRPGLPVSLSHEVAPIWREYERGTTVTVDAFTKPLFDGYVDGLSRALEETGAGGTWSLLKSNGGRAVASEARSRPAHLLLSGIAGGGIGGAYVARAAGVDRALALDMGGTSCDVCVILERRASLFVRLRARVRLPGQRAERLDEDDRRGRRLDRMGRPRRLPPGRASERGRRPGTCLLRPRRRGGDDHRREPRARPARSRILPRRTTPARPDARLPRPRTTGRAARVPPSSRPPPPWCASATRTWRTRSGS